MEPDEMMMSPEAPAAPSGAPDLAKISELVASVQMMLDELKGMLPEAAKEEKGELDEGELDAEAEGEAAQSPGPKGAGSKGSDTSGMERELLMKSLQSV